MPTLTPRRAVLGAVATAAIAGLAAVTVPALASDSGDEPAPLIVGGGEVTKEQPWAAALHRDGDFNCSASQINEEWVLTAAHCVKTDGDYSVRIGSLERSSGGETRDIDQIVSHPDYDGKHEYDIALVKLDEPHDNTGYAPLADDDDLGELGQESIIYGWGKEEADWSGPTPENLKYARGETTDKWCDYSSMVCFSGEGAAAGGDSGGPMFIESAASGDFVQIGVCAASYNPVRDWSGYTSVPLTSDWIAEVTG